MTKSKTRRNSRRYKNKRGGVLTTDLDKLERGPTPEDVTPYNIPADPLRGEKADRQYIKEILSLKRLPTPEVAKFFSKLPPEERERSEMANEELNQIVGEYDKKMDPWTGEENMGGRHRRKHRKSRKSRRHRRSRRH